MQSTLLERLNQVNIELEDIKCKNPQQYGRIVELWCQRENLVEQINIQEEEENGDY